MAKYLLKNVQILEGTNSRGKYHWLVGQLFNDTNIRMNGERRMYYSVSEDECKLYLDAGVCEVNKELSTDKITVYNVNDASLKEAIAPGGKLADFGDIRHLNAVKVTWPLNGVWGQIYRQDVYDDNHNLIHSKGDLRITETGQVMEFRELSFYLATDIDEDTKERIYSQDAQAVANRILERGYIKLEEKAPATQPSVAQPQTPEAPQAPQTQAEIEAQIAALKSKLEGSAA